MLNSLRLNAGVWSKFGNKQSLLSILHRKFAQETFISKHFRVDRNEIRNLLLLNDLECREAGDKLEIRECNLCDKANKGKADNLWKLLINPDGSYHCYRCAVHGSWFDLKKRLSGTSGKLNVGSDNEDDGDKVSSHTEIVEQHAAVTIPFPDQHEANQYPRLLFSSSNHPGVVQAKTYLNKTRGLSDAILARYGVGVTYLPFRSDEAPVATSEPSVDSSKESSDAPDKKKAVKPSDTFSAQDHLCITFPWIVRQDELSPDERLSFTNKLIGGSESGADSSTSTASGFVVKRIKARSILTKGLQRLIPKGGSWGFFGWHTLPIHTQPAADAGTVVITEGEFDAMAVCQATNLPSISLPNGCNSLPVDLLPMLENFSKIILWMDNDEPGRAGCDKFVRKLGIKRCSVVRPLEEEKEPPKDANEALLRPNGVQMIKKMIDQARPMLHDRIQSFNDIKAEVFQEILNPVKFVGTQVTSLPSVNKILKGFRRGEMVIFTGPTGSGKTTLLSQMSLDFARQGHGVLWGSFEIKNTRLMKKMIQQYHKLHSLNQLTHAQLLMVSEGFSDLPLYFMNYHGGTDVDQVLEAMDFSVYKNDIQHIFIDNLQFMMLRSSNKKGRSSSSMSDVFEVQDMLIDKFRKFATDRDVNIILVVHPRKEMDGSSLGLSSVFGTAKATQEADAVIVLQSIGNYNDTTGDPKTANNKFLDIKKNRFDGDLGSIPLGFSPLTNLFYEITGPVMPDARRPVKK